MNPDRYPSSFLVYIAGPLTHGDRAENIRLAFEAASELLRAAADDEITVSPIIPHAYAVCHAIDPHDYEFWMRADFGLIEACDALLRIPGYSPGSDREVAYARALDIPVFESVFELREWLRGEHE
jgi:nucleoside 2-deoxyribosyltransferase